ncbi:hypothetical protein ACVWZA_000446 [Sphingomonas sp. UYAg733]
MDDWISFADHWQTLIAGILAILAALLGAGLVYHQTRQTRAIEEDRLQRRNAAARSTLPLVLSSIMNYARQVAAGMRQLYLSSVGNHIDRDQLLAWDIPTVPQGETAALATVIEAAANDTADVIADLLGHLQVQSGRIREMQANAAAGTPGRRNILKTALEEYLLDVADLHARCELLLDYARREAETVQAKPGAEDLLRALFLMGFHETVFERIKATVRRRNPQPVAESEPFWKPLWRRLFSRTPIAQDQTQQ